MIFDDSEMFWIVFSQAHFLQPFWMPHQPRWTCKRFSHFFDPLLSLYRFVWCFCCFVYVFGWFWIFFHFHIFCRGVHFPFAHVFHFVVAAVREQVVTAVEKQHTGSVHPRSIFHIFIFWIHGFPWPPWFIFCCFSMFLTVCAGFSWFSMFLKCV